MAGDLALTSTCQPVAGNGHTCYFNVTGPAWWHVIRLRVFADAHVHWWSAWGVHSNTATTTASHTQGRRSSAIITTLYTHLPATSTLHGCMAHPVHAVLLVALLLWRQGPA